ncbi:DNase I-like protein [Hypoxylon fragiforme]|uniref:DNase I-like protein n=1 Tax=Hypoxylon fragiforme TaxID=63214 RepID=UPI0020C63E22|nr:DNase I-like protein [Hypoxylon fragiforme]KAI2613544.1 DNase I-like protein [Hypoxylon fragiforme]
MDFKKVDELPVELNIITLNCWGLLHLSAHRAERLTAIGRELAAADPPPHIVGLQECWTQEDYRSIRRETRFVLPFGKFYHGGAFGAGLAILSRWPIEESTMFRYPLNGRPTAFYRGDWYVGKGVACARIRFGPAEKDIVEVFNTHTHAIYEHPPDKTDSYLVHRLAQAWEMAKLVRGAAERGHLVVALGDFNDVPLSLTYRILTAHAPIKDAWRVVNPDSSLGAAVHETERARRRPIPTAAFNIAENGVTSNSAYNTWTWPKSQQRAAQSGMRPMIVDPNKPDPRGKRIDYIFFSPQVASTPNPILRSVHEAAARASRDTAGENGISKGWVVKDIRVGMLGKHPELGCSLSDHFSVEATLLLHTSNSIPVSHPSSPLISSPSESKGHGNNFDRIVSIDSHPSTADHVRTDHAASLLALEHGTYLQSPTGSEVRVGSSNHRASFDAQLSSFAENSPSPTSRAKYDGLPCNTYDEIMSLIHAYAARERSQRYWRFMHCAAWAFVVLGCYVAVWFAPFRAISFAFLVVSSLGFLAGAVDGLIALLFFGTELRSLQEFEWEIMNTKATASGAQGLAVQQQLDTDDQGTIGGGGGDEKW